MVFGLKDFQSDAPTLKKNLCLITLKFPSFFRSSWLSKRASGRLSNLTSVMEVKNTELQLQSSQEGPGGDYVADVALGNQDKVS